NRLFGKQIRYLSRRALAALKAYHWPGNIREFAHAMQSAAMLTDGDRVCVGDLPENLSQGEAPTLTDEAATTPAEEFAFTMQPARFSLDDVINKASKTALLRALREAGGNCHRAAQLLGVSRYTVYRMIARYGLAPSRGRQNPGLDAIANAATVKG
ncbi:MAG TPA: helix-turn-helix domain-containing protein, partial [Candidatus Binataceae bacterium]|nr:helix-turn-helix domain-containing protein [Candidatus Binataceae bacterium]